MTVRASALAAAVMALLVAGPAFGGGPTDPPEGDYDGYVQLFLIPPFYLEKEVQCLRVSCWSPPPGGPVMLGVEMWSETDQDPLTNQATIILRPPNFVSWGQLCIPFGGPEYGSFVSRISIEPAFEKAKSTIRCTAELYDYQTERTVGVIPVQGISKTKSKTK
jgi:hypothetical protein